MAEIFGRQTGTKRHVIHSGRIDAEARCCRAKVSVFLRLGKLDVPTTGKTEADVQPMGLLWPDMAHSVAFLLEVALPY